MGGPEKSKPLNNKPTHHHRSLSSCDALSSLLKSAFVVCIVVSIALVAYSTFSRPISLPGSTTRLWSSSSSSSPFSAYRSSSPALLATCHPPPSLNSSAPTNISHILFGLGGSASTWHRRRGYTELWWLPNVTRGFVWLDETPPSNYTWPETSPPFRISGPLSKGFRPSDRIARIVKEGFELMMENSNSNIRWFVMGDDDTVFFTENLVTVLSRYDHRRMYYVGGISESVEQDDMHSYQTAFGGGGFAVSYGLACQLARMMDGCLQRYKSFYGSDEKVSACAGDLGVPLTRESGFHQLDVRGDPYGLLAAHPISPLVSLHHLDYVDPLISQQTQLDSLKSLMQAYRADPSRTIQQSICYDRYRKWSLSVSWGYSIQLYPSLISSRELEMPLQTFKTWRSWSAGPFIFNTRPVKPDPCGQPIIYFLDRVRETGKGKNETLTEYKKVKPEPGKSCDKSAYKYAAGVEKILVVAPKMDRKDWLTEPRRQCCEMNNGWILQKNMHVIVRNCKPGEMITA